MHGSTDLGVNPWILDLGASNHMTPHKYLLHNIQPLAVPFLITLPNGYKVKVISTGSLHLRHDITLHNVLLVPSFQFNLLSVYQLIKQLNCSAVFFIFTCYLQGPSLKRPLKIGRSSNRLYYCAADYPAHPSSHVPATATFNDFLVSSTKSTFLSCNSSQTENKLDLFWHQRLCHMPYHKMKSIHFLHSQLSFKQNFICDVCPKARQHRSSFPNSIIHTTVPFQLVHIDIWGPYHTKTYNGFRYFLTLVDDFTRVTWTHLLSCKGNALSILKTFVAMVKVHFNTQVQSFRSDNSYELGSILEAASFFSKNGILHQTTIPHTPQQNSVVERKHKHLCETSRALLF